MPTPARREISAIEISASGSANAVRAAARILSRLRSASARFAGDLEVGRDMVGKVERLSVTLDRTGSPFLAGLYLGDCRWRKDQRPHAANTPASLRDHDRPITGRLPRRPPGLARGGHNPGDRACVAVRSPHADRRRPERTDLRRLDTALGPRRTDPTTAPRPARDQQPLPAARDAGQDRRDCRHRLRRTARLRYRRRLTTQPPAGPARV